MKIRIFNFNEYYKVDIQSTIGKTFEQKFGSIYNVIDKKFTILVSDIKYENYVITADINQIGLTNIEFNMLVDYIRVTPKFPMYGFKANNDDTISVDVIGFDIFYEHKDILKLRSAKLQRIINKNLEKKLKKESENNESIGYVIG